MIRRYHEVRPLETAMLHALNLCNPESIFGQLPGSQRSNLDRVTIADAVQKVQNWPLIDLVCCGAWVARTAHADCIAHVRSRGQNGKHLLALSFSGFDPRRTLSKRIKARRSGPLPIYSASDFALGLKCKGWAAWCGSCWIWAGLSERPHVSQQQAVPHLSCPCRA